MSDAFTNLVSLGADPEATDLPLLPQWDMDDIRATHGPDGKPVPCRTCGGRGEIPDITEPGVVGGVDQCPDCPRPLRPMEACIYAVLPVLDSAHPAKLEIASRIMQQALDAFDPECDGMCVTAGDVGLGPAEGVDYRDIAYPHPGCPLHAPEQVCGCGQPDRCMSPTHGQITPAEALEIRYRQNPSDPRAR